MTIREPAEYYFSLWSYGLERKGGLRCMIEKLDPRLTSRMYGSLSRESFAWFLDYVLHSPVRYPSVGRYDWLPMCCDMYTTRALSMMVPIASRLDFIEALRADFSPPSFVRASRPFWPEVLLRTSTLNSDFYVLVAAGALDFLDLKSDWKSHFSLHAEPLNSSLLSAGAGLYSDDYWTDNWLDCVREQTVLPLTLFEQASRVITDSQR